MVSWSHYSTENLQRYVGVNNNIETERVVSGVKFKIKQKDDVFQFCS